MQTNIFDKFSNELYLDDVVIYTDMLENISDGIGYVKKDNDGRFYILNIDLFSVSNFVNVNNLERKGNSK